LGKFLNTKDSIRAYIAFRPFLQLAEEKYIAPIVPPVVLSELKTAIQDNDINAVQSNAIALISKVIAWYAFFEGLPFLNVRMEGTGIYIAVVQDGSTKYHVPSEKVQNLLRQATEQNALLFYNQLKKQYEPTEELTPQTTIFDNHTKPDFWV
jgi:hypothetical protein